MRDGDCGRITRNVFRSGSRRPIDASLTTLRVSRTTEGERRTTSAGNGQQEALWIAPYDRAQRFTLSGMTKIPSPRLDTRRPFTRKSALAARVTVAELVGPRFQRIYHGIYVAADVQLTVAVRAQAALLVAPDGSYASHHTAIALWGGWAPKTAETHISSPIKSTRSERRGIVAHAADPDVVPQWRSGIQVSPPARAFLELAANAGRSRRPGRGR